MIISKNAMELVCGELRFNSRGDFESKVVEISPDLAKKLYECSSGNRQLKVNHLRNLINQIKNNEFVLTNNAISFDTSLNLRDGHHRLKAISMAEKTVKAVVSVNIPSDNFRYVDRGAMRSMSDVIALNSKHSFGFGINSNSVSVANFIIRIGDGLGYEKNLDSNFIESVLKENEVGICFVMEHFPSGVRGISNAGVKAAIASAHRYVPQEKLELFCLILARGSASLKTADSNAALICRDFILEPQKAFSGLGLRKSGDFTCSKVFFMVVQYCIKAFVSGNNLNRVITGVKKNKETGALVFNALMYPPKFPAVK
jgi:hypothetical protein